MKQINDWIDIITSWLPPFTLPSLGSLTLIFTFSPDKMALVTVVRMAILCFFVAAAVYFIAINYQWPYPKLIAAGGAFMLSAPVYGVFKILWQFMKEPIKTIQEILGIFKRSQK